LFFTYYYIVLAFDFFISFVFLFIIYFLILWITWEDELSICVSCNCSFFFFCLLFLDLCSFGIFWVSLVRLEWSIFQNLKYSFEEE
jgi:hypothetical protein